MKDIWKGFFYKKVYRDEEGTTFPMGVAKYAVYNHSKLLGYCDTSQKPDDFFLEKLGLKKEK